MNSWVVWLSVAFGVLGVSYATTSSDREAPKRQYENAVDELEQRIGDLESQLSNVESQLAEHRGKLESSIESLKTDSRENLTYLLRIFIHHSESLLELEKCTLFFAKTVQINNEGTSLSNHLSTVVNALDDLFVADRTFLTGKRTIGLNQFIDQNTD